MKFARLTECIAAGGCVDNEKDLVRRGRIVFGQSAFHFLELSRQVALGMQTAGGVAEQKINLVVRRFLIGIVTKRSWIRAVWTLHHSVAASIGPTSKQINAFIPELTGVGDLLAISIF